MYTAIIPAAGSGTRLGLGYNKLLYKIVGKTIIEYTVDVFLQNSKCQHIIITASDTDIQALKNMFQHIALVSVVSGGVTRQESVANALQFTTTDCVLIHDGARPLLTQALIDACYEQVEQGKIAIAGVPIKDTIKRQTNNMVVETVSRDELIAVQTPQAFRAALLKNVHLQAKSDNFTATDDAMLIEKYSELPIVIVSGLDENIKITTQADLDYLKFKLEKGKS